MDLLEHHDAKQACQCLQEWKKNGMYCLNEDLRKTRDVQLINPTFKIERKICFLIEFNLHFN